MNERRNGHDTYDKKAVRRFAGAFIAWVIGSGFATGQEVLQFFASFGYRSYGVVLINLVGFVFLGQVFLETGFEEKAQVSFNNFKHFCGERLGTFYSWLIPLTLLLVMPVLVSGAGATLYEYYGLHHAIGTGLMAAMVLIAYLIGFERLVNVVSSIGPFIIGFSIVVGTITVIRDIGRFGDIKQFEPLLRQWRAAPHWLLSSILYLSLNFLGGSAYFSALGASANNRKEAKMGALFGALALVLTIVIMNTAVLLNAKDAAGMAIPVLYLAREISSVLGGVFSIALILGMFSSCSAMMWSVCSRFTMGGERGNRIFAGVVAVFIFVLGLFSFSELVSIFYPLVGYLGLAFIGCVTYKGIRRYGDKK